MGAGKTAVGKRLAQRLGLPFVDLDHEIEQPLGTDHPRPLPRARRSRASARSSREVLASRGGAARGVIATGGGVVERAPNIATMLRDRTRALARRAVRYSARAAGALEGRAPAVPRPGAGATALSNRASTPTRGATVKIDVETELERRPGRGLAERLLRDIVRYLIFSDVHASVDALEAVLRARAPQALRRRSSSLGDLVGYGAAPNQVIEMVRRLQRRGAPHPRQPRQGGVGRRGGARTSTRSRWPPARWTRRAG